MSIGTQFCDSSNEANVYPPHVMSYGQPSSSTNEKYGMSRCSPSTQMSYQVPYQMEWGFDINTWVNFEYLIHMTQWAGLKRYMHYMLEFLTNIVKAHWVGTNIVSNNKMGFLHLPIPLNHIDSHFGTKRTLQCNVYKLLIFNEMKYFMWLHNECTITKLTFLIDRLDIITSNIANYIILYYIYIYIYIYIKFFNKTTLKFLLYF